MEEACRPGERECPPFGQWPRRPQQKYNVNAPTRAWGIPLVSVNGVRAAAEGMPGISVAGVRRESFLCPFAKSLTPAWVSSLAQRRRPIEGTRPVLPSRRARLAFRPVPVCPRPLAAARPRTTSGQCGPGRPGWDHLPPPGNMLLDIVRHSTWLGCRFGRLSRGQRTCSSRPSAASTAQRRPGRAFPNQSLCTADARSAPDARTRRTIGRFSRGIPPAASPRRPLIRTQRSRVNCA